jgi:hypothetical protein
LMEMNTRIRQTNLEQFKVNIEDYRARTEGLRANVESYRLTDNRYIEAARLWVAYNETLMRQYIAVQDVAINASRTDIEGYNAYYRAMESISALLTEQTVKKAQLQIEDYKAQGDIWSRLAVSSMSQINGLATLSTTATS